jgi:hypothetical protein
MSKGKTLKTWRDLSSGNIALRGKETYPYGDIPPVAVKLRSLRLPLSSQREALGAADYAATIKALLCCFAVIVIMSLIGCAAALRQAEAITHRVTDCVFGADPASCSQDVVKASTASN